MTASKGEFFIPANSVYNISDEEYERIELLINAAKAFARATHQCVYIIDYFRKGFLYVSDNIEMLCGEPVDKVREFGYDLYLKHVPEEEQRMLLEINREGFNMANTIEPEEKVHYTISYDFHLINNGRKILINHKMTPLALTSDGRIWLALCVVSAATHTDAGHIEMHRVGSSDFFEYHVASRRWHKRQMPTLTDSERSVLTLSIQGYTMAEIADRICLSPDTIKKYRQRIFEKLEVRNISEAIVAAINNKLL